MLNLAGVGNRKTEGRECLRALSLFSERDYYICHATYSGPDHGRSNQIAA
jgi:hypothetical protein